MRSKSSVPQGRPPVPRPGPTPLPTLAALPSLTDSRFYAHTAVPHGTLEQVRYTNVAGKEKRLHVYLPPGYADSRDTRFPVLYLNHGGGEDDARWSSPTGGCAPDILDNLITVGKARPIS